MSRVASEGIETKTLVFLLSTGLQNAQILVEICFFFRLKVCEETGLT